MKCLHIITPVKDSIDSTLETVKAIMESDILVPFTYTVYNDFSTEENTHRLEEAARQWNFRLVNLSDLTDHPSPNYLLVLQTAQKTLDPSKNWYDVTISHESLKRGFQNYLFTTLPVWHRPHSSRPWKQLKYKNPLKYYWLKYTKGLDKI